MSCKVAKLFQIEVHHTHSVVLTDKPEMDLAPQLAKAASNSGDTGRLVCRANGAPALNFTWQREGATIPTTTPQKYSFELRQVGTMTVSSFTIFYTGTLMIW